VKRCSDPVGDVDVDVDTQKNRARTTAALETALTQADAGNFEEARKGLQTTMDAIKVSFECYWDNYNFIANFTYLHFDICL
jgi:hypothetical protein